MKKFLSIALALLMVAVMLPVVALAADTSLPAAVDGVIKLTDNVELTGSYAVVGTDTSVLTLDLNGFTITKDANLALDVYGKLTIKDSSANGSGKIVSTKRTAGEQNATSIGIWVNANADVTLESGTIMGADYGVAVLGDNAKFTMNNGTVYGISGNGTQVNNGTTITIAGGEVKSGTNGDIAIYHPQNGTLNITGGTVSGSTAIYIKSGIVNISNATIKGTGAQAAPVANGNGANSTGDAIIMDSKAGYYGNMKLNIGAGNTITSTNGHALQVANTDVTVGTNVVSLDISGSTFTGNGSAVKLSEAFVTAVEQNENITATITNGTFSGDTTAIAKYIPENKTINSNGTVVDKTITIIVPSEGGSTTTTTPDTTKNPTTGANDFVGLAAAAAVVALLGSAVVLRKK